MKDMETNQDVKIMEKVLEQETLKKKYGKVYCITSELINDDEDTFEKKFYFASPNVASYDRYLKSMSKGMTKASNAFVLDNVVEEQRVELEDMAQRYPALCLALAQKLLAVLGMSNDVVLKLL